MKKMLISGGAGFIGSAFARKALDRGFDVAIVDSLTYAADLKRIESIYDKVAFFKCDISDFEELSKVFEQFKPDIVVHFAAETHVDRSILNPHIFIKTNVIGTQNMLELSKDAFFINISTDEVYGDLSKFDNSFSEESCLKPSSPYSTSKASQDMLARAYARTYNMNVVTIRPSNNYGPWQYPEKLIPLVIYKALQNEPIPVYAQGQNIREWTFITFVKDRPGHDFRYSLDSNKIKKAFNLSFVSFEEGIEKTVKWYIDNKSWLYEKASELKGYWDKVYKEKA